MLIVQRRRVSVYDPDAQAYIAAVEAADTQALEVGVKAADTQALEVGVKDAINAFVVGCKADGIWNAIKASCIMAGARTLAGALVPLVGAAPTRFGTEGGWNYNRKTGTAGNGTNNYLDSNFQFANLANAQNNNHLAYFRPSGDTGTATIAVNYDTMTCNLIINNGAARNFHENVFALSPPVAQATTGFRAITRSSSASYSYRAGGQVSSLSITSASAPSNRNIFVFARNNLGTIDSYATGRKAFYSIGESIDLALLDARVTTLINAIAAAIP
jgi:hypothetical protein